MSVAPDWPYITLDDEREKRRTIAVLTLREAIAIGEYAQRCKAWVEAKEDTDG